MRRRLSATATTATVTANTLTKMPTHSSIRQNPARIPVADCLNSVPENAVLGKNPGCPGTIHASNVETIEVADLAG